MPKHFPQELKREVAAVARSSGLTQAQVARDFGILENSVARWVKEVNIDDGLVEGAT
jgi:transposase